MSSNIQVHACGFLSADTVQHQREPFANSILSLMSVLPLAAKVPVKLVRSDAVITAFTLLPIAKLQAKNRELHFYAEPCVF